MAQRSLCSQPARADQHRRARQTAASLPCAAPGEQAAAAWPLCCAWCVVRVPPEAIQRAQPWTSRLTCGCTCTPERRSPDTLPEWSKGVDSSSTSASCVGSNPTGVNPQAQRNAQHKLTAIDCAELSLPVLPTGAQFVVCGTLSTGDDRYLWAAACCLPCCCCRAHICRLACACACQRGPRRHVARQVATWQPSR